MPILRPPACVPAYAPRCAEQQRLIDDAKALAPWKKWGTYLSERCWGTVREDYSSSGDAWNYLTHDLARSVAYRWGEDGMAGWCDAMQYLCFAPAFWNGRDPILKERAFGLSGYEGNHGEDVKEYYYYLDNTPTHSYALYLYKYPQEKFPYDDLVRVNNERKRDPCAFEYKLLDTGVFEAGRYFDIFVEYAKAAPESTVIRIRAINRGPDAAKLWLLPTLWFRDTWSWASVTTPSSISTAAAAVPSPYPLPRREREQQPSPTRLPRMRLEAGDAHDARVIRAEHPQLGARFLHFPPAGEVLFTENATNAQRTRGVPNAGRYCKDAFHEYLVSGMREAVNPAGVGSKAAPVYAQTIAAGAEQAWTFILSDSAERAEFDPVEVIARRKAECDEFYNTIHNPTTPAEDRRVQRAALSGLLWNKQFYFFDVRRWMEEDCEKAGRVLAPPPKSGEAPAARAGAACRRVTRNRNWRDLNADFVLSMPDKWEYPWFAAWDLSFQCVSLALVDPDFAKEQLMLLTSEALMHPNGQIPAYEWEFSDANPPVQAWAAWKVYQSGQRHFGITDRDFLSRVFHKLLLNFAWWVNRKDANDNNIFEGGFLGLDNIAVFDRSEPLPGGGFIEQSDGTAWMGLFSLNMMRIAFELALHDPVYEDLATKFFEHFMQLADAINHDDKVGPASDPAGRDAGPTADDPEAALGLWDECDGFYYDQLRYPDGRTFPLRVRSLVGLLPLVASEILLQEDLDRLPLFKARYDWFLENRPRMARTILSTRERSGGKRHLLSIVGEKRFRRILRRLLDENEFLCPYGLRSLSKIHEASPFEFSLDGRAFTPRYEPAEALTKVKGGNSNWRGPIWFPTCCLLLDSLLTFDRFIGTAIKFPFPANDGVAMSCAQIAHEIGTRMLGLFLRDGNGRRPCFGAVSTLQDDPHWRDHPLFFEYFHGDNGAGLGAMHQTGWTAFIANVIDRKYR